MPTTSSGRGGRSRNWLFAWTEIGAVQGLLATCTLQMPAAARNASQVRPLAACRAMIEPRADAVRCAGFGVLGSAESSMASLVPKGQWE